MDDIRKNELEINTQGTPQGGVISPLLSNIALHGLEKHTLKGFSRDAIKLIRYADDFVVMGKELKDIARAKGLVEEYLKPVGLKLSESKTRIGHTMGDKEGTTGPVGLDFLSYHFRNLPRSRHRGVKNTRGVTQPFIQISKPTRKSVRKHKDNLKHTLKVLKSAPLPTVIKELAAKIRG